MAREDSIWSSLHSVSPQVDASNEPPRVRLLRTSDDKPTAPRLQDFFPREPRTIDRWLVLWDPGRAWSGHALADLTGDGSPPPGATRLSHAGSDKDFALVHHALVTGGDGRLYGVLHIEADAGDACCADLALTLLERSDHAGVLTGYSSEYREVPRRLAQFCGQAAWRGPVLQFVIPQDKPSRAERLRRVAWPRSVDVRVLEAPSDRSPGWLAPLLDRLAGLAAFVPSEDDRHGADAEGLPNLPLPSPFADAALAELPTRPSLPSCARAAEVAALAPGAEAVAVLDACSHGVLGAVGETAAIDVAKRVALQLWGQAAAHSAPSMPLDELLWRGRRRLVLAQPLPHHPGLLIVGAFHSQDESLDLRHTRWQWAVAAREFAAT